MGGSGAPEATVPDRGLGPPGHLIGPLGLPAAQRRLLERDWVRHRVLLAPWAVPSYRGRPADRLVLLHGSLRGGIEPEGLFASLTQECRVFPFLFARVGREVLLGVLGAGRESSSGFTRTPPRRAATSMLRAALESIQSWEEDLARLAVPVDHRYDRLAPPEGAGPAAEAQGDGRGASENRNDMA